MPSVISLKEIKTNSTLKDQLRKLEIDRDELLKQLDFQKKVETKLREDIISQKKDFEHLEKQFEHFAGIEAELEELQSTVAMERLERLIDSDKVEDKSNDQLDKARAELKKTQAELKELKQLDPVRLKRQVTDLKKKTATQADENKAINKALVTARKELRDMTAEKDKLNLELEACRKGLDFVWQSTDKQWVIYETDQRMLDDDDKKDTIAKRVKCLHTTTGRSWLSVAVDDDGKALWLGDSDIPEDVSIEAGKRHKSIATAAE